MRFGLAVAVMMLTVGSVGAKADATYPVSGSTTGFSGSGTLTASSNGDGSYTVTGMTGTGVTSLLDPGAFHGNDNLLFPSANPVLDNYGLSFTDTMDGEEYLVDLYYSASQQEYYAHVQEPDGDLTDVLVDFTLGDATSTSSPSVRTAFATQLRALATSSTTKTFSFAFAPAASTAAVTPEPSSFALLGTGFLGLAGVLRKRSRRG